MLRFFIFTVLMAVVLPSCSSGPQVMVVDQPPTGGRYLGWVSVDRTDLGTISSDLGHMAGVNRLKKQTAAMGGTHLVLDPDSREPRSWAFSHQLSGKAFLVEDPIMMDEQIVPLQAPLRVH